MSVDRVRYPSVHQYLETVGGVGAHPQATAKGGVLADALSQRPLQPPPGSLGPELEALATNPPLLTGWVPEVQFNASMLAIYDEHYGAGGMSAYLDWVYDRNRRLFTRPAYKILFLVVSPERLIRGLGARWAAFRKGSTLTASTRGPKHVELRLAHPRHLHPEQSLRAFARAWQAAVEFAGGKDVESALVHAEPTEAQYSIRWR
ncbi:MAG: hypothetical protein WKG00_23910 [Polyangiaceae bacterium]